MVTVTLMLLLSLVAVGMLSLATVEVRSTSRGSATMEAKSNARLALMTAMGELQRFMGPDQRVCAGASILNSSTQGSDGNWLGVWRTTGADGSPLYIRDDNGALRDTRNDQGWRKDEGLLTYLVSGNEGGIDGNSKSFVEPGSGKKDRVTVVGEGSVLPNRVQEDSVEVPLVNVLTDEGAGKFGYWVGDLSSRANVAVVNPYDGKFPNPNHPKDGGYYQQLTALEADETLLGSAVSATDRWEETKKGALASSGTVGLLTGKDWTREHFHDFTHFSRGVLADARDGGMKANLTVFLEDGSTYGEGGEISDSDPLVGWDFSKERDDQNNPFGLTAPRFGLLRDWVQSAPRFAEDFVESKIPQSEGNPVIVVDERMALANDNPTALKGRSEADLMPVLVEGSMYSTFSYHPNPAGFRKRYNIRSHHWPRVVLWNPYDVDIEVPQTVMMMQLNTRNDFHTTIEYAPGLRGRAEWVSWGGGTRTRPPEPFENIEDSENYNDPYTGMFYFSLESEKIGAGECLVFSTKEAREYDSQNLMNNQLSAKVAPDPARNLYISSSEFDDDDTGSGFNYRLLDFWYAPPSFLGRPINNQADDSRMMWKKAATGSLDVYGFDNLPQLALVSCSLQFGAGKEPRISWSENRRMPIEFTTLVDPVVSRVPDVRTREGFRLRWFEEHESNRGVGNNPAGPGIFETAPLANWNPRAAYAIRSPWENIGGDQGDGSASGPWFFGNYTRDLYDENAVGWDAQQPRLVNGTYRGNPFGTPQDVDFRDRNILFSVPREETGIFSLAQFQHAKLSEFSWHPAFAAGNSLCDPRLGLEGLVTTIPDPESSSGLGWDAKAIGWSGDTDRSKDQDEWARFGRAILQNIPEEEPLVYDLSFELNQTLWDHFFLSTGSKNERSDLVAKGSPLPNSRMIPTEIATEKATEGLFSSASAFYVDGAFNVNSTSVDAWKALLGATRQINSDSSGDAVFPRYLDAVGGSWSGDGFADDQNAWSGTRALSADDIDLLARAIVNEVRLRGPFLSLSDFVNRRLRADETGQKGALQAAIDKAGLNVAFESSYFMDNDSSLPDYRHPDNIADATRIEQTLKPESKAWGATTFLTQADVLQQIGPVLTPRSDSFIIRAYGESTDKAGNVKAKAWCEAVVQRTPEPFAPDSTGLNPDPSKTESVWGRRFEIVSFRWLGPSEV